MQVIAQMAGDRHGSRLTWVAVVTVAAGLSGLPPAVAFDEPDDLPYLQAEAALLGVSMSAVAGAKALASSAASPWRREGRQEQGH